MQWRRIVVSLFLVLGLLCTAAGAEDLTGILINSRTAQSFTDEAVSDEDLNLILEAGLAATSAINQQPWFFVAVSNQEVLSEISGGSGMPAGDGTEASSGAPAGDGTEASSGAPAGDGTEASSGVPAGDGTEASSGAPAGDGTGASSGAPAGGSAKAGLGDSPVAIIIYMNEGTSSPNASFDCGLACENMFIAARALGYGAKIVSSPTMQLNGANHDAICEKLGVDKSYTAVAVLLIGREAETEDGVSGASVRNTLEDKVSIVK